MKSRNIAKCVSFWRTAYNFRLLFFGRGSQHFLRKSVRGAVPRPVGSDRIKRLPREKRGGNGGRRFPRLLSEYSETRQKVFIQVCRKIRRFDCDLRRNFPRERFMGSVETRFRRGNCRRRDSDGTQRFIGIGTANGFPFFFVSGAVSDSESSENIKTF